MKPKKRQKLCHHCEGEVDLDVIVCPFCAADLREEKPELPKYASFINKPPQIDPYIEEKPALIAAAIPQQEEANSPLKSAIGPMALFIIGMHLFLLSLFLLFFSSQGILLLKFNAAWWPFHLIASIPFLIFGYRAISKL